MPIFACETCASTSIKPPKVLNDAAAVHCYGCGARLGTWGEFKDVAARLIAREACSGERPGRRWTGADPLPSHPAEGP